MALHALDHILSVPSWKHIFRTTLHIDVLPCRYFESDSPSRHSRPLLTETPFESVEASLTSDFDWDAAVGEEARHLPRLGSGRMPTLEQQQQVSTLQSKPLTCLKMALMLWQGLTLGGATSAVHSIDLSAQGLGSVCHHMVLVIRAADTVPSSLVLL